MSLFDRDKSAERMPVSLITGFLGSGKTTLLNRVLGDPRMARSLVLVNEFGEVGLDHLFMESLSGDMVLLQSGCVCCTIQGDLDRTLRDIARRRANNETPPFDRVLLETTGLADPAPILQLLLNNPMISHDYRLDGVVATVDALNGARQLDEHQEAVKQAAVADRLLISKTDLADIDTSAQSARPAGGPQSRRPALRGRAGRDRPGAAVRFRPVRSRRQERPRAAMAERRGARPIITITSIMTARATTRISAPSASPSTSRWTGIASIRWLMAVRASWGDRLLRVKGVLNVVGESQPLVIHGVHRTFHPPTLLARWPDDDRRSRLVFITRDLDRATVEASWREMQDA